MACPLRWDDMTTLQKRIVAGVVPLRPQGLCNLIVSRCGGIEVGNEGDDSKKYFGFNSLVDISC